MPVLCSSVCLAIEPDDFFQQVDVILKRTCAFSGKAVAGVRSIVDKCLGYHDVTRLLQGANVDTEIAIRHAEHFLEFAERHFGIGCQYGHDGHAPLFVDDLVQLIECLCFSGWLVAWGSVKNK